MASSLPQNTCCYYNVPLCRRPKHSRSRRSETSLGSNLFIYSRRMGALVSDGQYATNPNISACIDFRRGPGGTGMLIGPIIRQLQPTPYTNVQRQEHDPLVLYGQLFRISSNDTGNVVESVLGSSLHRHPHDRSAHFAAVG